MRNEKWMSAMISVGGVLIALPLDKLTQNYIAVLCFLLGLLFLYNPLFEAAVVILQRNRKIKVDKKPFRKIYVVKNKKMLRIMSVLGVILIGLSIYRLTRSLIGSISIAVGLLIIHAPLLEAAIVVLRGRQKKECVERIHPLTKTEQREKTDDSSAN